MFGPTFSIVLLLVHSVSSEITNVDDTGRICKSIPGSARWPSSREWNRLNSTLGGRLLQPPAPGAVCHSGQPRFNETECKDTAQRWSTPVFHINDPISVFWNQYTNDSCLPNGAFPCSRVEYPVFVVNATSPEHVKLGVDFARKHSIRLVVKNTGHDYLGRSVAPNSLSIWTRHMNHMAFQKDTFRLQGCHAVIHESSVAVGAGAEMHDIYEYLDTFGQTIVGGMGKTIGMGGYVTGGGHSPLSPRYGLAADQVLQMEMVTPDGEVVIVNECQHSDLFWAMRGGGGSTFGILTSVTMRTYPSPKVLGLEYFLITEPNSQTTSDVIAFVWSKLPGLVDAGLSGPQVSFSSMPNPIDNGTTAVGGMFGRLFMPDTNKEEDMLALLNPIVTEANATWPGIQFWPRFTPYSSYLEWFNINHDNDTVGRNRYLTSQLLGERALQGDMSALRNAISASLKANILVDPILVGGKALREVDIRGGSNAVNPGWRESSVLVVSLADFPPLNVTAEAEALEALKASMGPFRQLATGLGAYLNEALPFEPNWQQAFWGANYDRLLKIKRAVDPQDVFWCQPCVGNGGWKEIDGKLCKA